MKKTNTLVILFAAASLVFTSGAALAATATVHPTKNGKGVVVQGEHGSVLTESKKTPAGKVTYRHTHYTTKKGATIDKNSVSKTTVIKQKPMLTSPKPAPEAPAESLVHTGR